MIEMMDQHATATRFLPHPFRVHTLMLQPGTLCNLDCNYCFLPARKSRNLMDPQIARRVATDLRLIKGDGGVPISLLWHASEPTSVGIEHFATLMEPFADLEADGVVQHAIQTNGTLLDDRWCDLFARHRMSVGLSIDGPEEATTSRVDWRGKPAYVRILHGVEMLRTHGIPFGVIGVVGTPWLGRANDLYAFYRDLGCERFAINIEEWEGPQLDREIIDDEEAVVGFWKDLFRAWIGDRDGRLGSRDLAGAMEYIRGLSAPDIYELPTSIDVLPAVSWTGDVTVLAPQLIDRPAGRYGTFSIGNVLETSFADIMRTVPTVPYVRDYLAGSETLSCTCPYFGYCAGGSAASRFFEHGSTAGGCSAFCRNTRRRLLDAIISEL